MFVVDLQRVAELMTLSRLRIEAQRDLVEVSLTVDGQVGTLWEVLSQQAVGVLVAVRANVSSAGQRAISTRFGSFTSAEMCPFNPLCSRAGRGLSPPPRTIRQRPTQSQGATGDRVDQSPSGVRHQPAHCSEKQRSPEAANVQRWNIAIAESHSTAIG